MYSRDNERGMGIEEFRLQREESEQGEHSLTLPVEQAPVEQAHRPRRSKLHDEVRRTIALQEQQQAWERQLQREMREFLHETSKLAARILSKATELQKQQMAQRVTQEMEEYFELTAEELENVANTIRLCCDGENVLSEEEIEAHMTLSDD